MSEIFSTCRICHGKIGLKPCNCVLQNNKHDLGVAEAIGFDKGYKAATAKTLTDEEIHDLIVNKVTDSDMIKEALRKAQEK